MIVSALAWSQEITDEAQGHPIKLFVADGGSVAGKSSNQMEILAPTGSGGKNNDYKP